MCGGAIISDYVDGDRGRKLTTTEELWSELDAFSDLLDFDSNANSDFSEHKVSSKDEQVPEGSNN